MKLIPTLTLLAAAGLVFVTARAADAMSAQARTAIEQAVLARFDQMVGAAESRNVEQLFADVAENDRGAVVLNGRLLRTRAEALETVRGNFRGVAAIKYQFQDRLVTVLSPTSALLVATGVTNVQTEDGRSILRPFTHSIVFVLQNGSWRVMHSHQSTAPQT